MIILSGTVDVDPARRDAALEAGKPHMEATRARPGCLHYNWSPDLLTPGRIYVYEAWESPEALAAHLKGSLYLAMRDTIASFGLRGADVAKHAVAKSGPVYDATGTPRADFFDSE